MATGDTQAPDKLYTWALARRPACTAALMAGVPPVTVRLLMALVSVIPLAFIASTPLMP